jgi:hypothetical protein
MIMGNEVLKTTLQQEREQRDLAVYSDYEQMMSIPGQSATEVTKALMKKYGIYSQGTIYIIRKRVAERLQKEGGVS